MSELTVEELQKQIEELEKQNKNLKTTLSERNTEAANRKREAESWKEKYTSTLSEQEKAEAARKEQMEKTAKEIAELRRDRSISTYKSKYLAMGYSEELAQSSAEARVDGNDDVLFSNEQKFISERDEALKADLLKSQPTIQSGKAPEAQVKTKKEIMEIKDTEERQKAWAEYIEAERRK